MNQGRVNASIVARIACVLGAAVCMLGCGSAPISAEDEELAQLQHVLAAVPFVKQVVGRDIVDFKGRRWKHLGRANIVSDDDELAVSQAQRATARSTPPVKSKPESEMTVEELADALRPATIIAGQQYTLAEPDMDAAMAAMEYMRREKNGLAPLPPVRNGGPPPGYDADPELLDAKVLEGSDNRVQHRNNTTYPFRSIVWLTNSSQTGYCTGTFIGPSTMLTAAHCVHSNNPTTGWYSARWWAPGVDSQDANRFTYKPFTNYPSSSAALIEWCYQGFVPLAYHNGSSDKQYDYAVLEFSSPWGCNIFPGNAVGWLGTLKASNGSLSGQTIYGYGYPRGSSADFGCPGASNCNWPQIWGMGQTGSLDYSGCCEVNYDVDTSKGHSGQSMYLLWGSDRYVVAAHHSGSTGVFDDYNFGRRITEVVYDFFEANTAWRRDSDLYKFPSLGIGHD